MTAAWIIIVVHLENARHDLTLVTDRTIPEWGTRLLACARAVDSPWRHMRGMSCTVDAALYGTFVIFWSFAVVQIIYQRNIIPVEPNSHLFVSMWTCFVPCRSAPILLLGHAFAC